jgi:hypothetical protein
MKPHHEKLPLAYPPIRKASKSGLAWICSKQARELTALRAEVVALRAAASKPVQAPAAGKIAAREEAKVKLAAEIAAAKQSHAELAAREEAEAPERARLQVAWEKELRETRRAKRNVWQRQYRADNPDKCHESVVRWRLAHPDKVKANNDAKNEVRRQKTAAARLERLAAKEQIRAGVDLLQEATL